MIDAREEAYARHADITLDTSDIAVEDAAQTVADAVMQFWKTINKNSIEV